MVFVINALIDYKKFLSDITKCQGKVELLIDEDSRLDLRSALSQLVTVGDILKNLDEYEDIRIYIEKNEDVDILERSLKLTKAESSYIEEIHSHIIKPVLKKTHKIKYARISNIVAYGLLVIGISMLLLVTLSTLIPA